MHRSIIALLLIVYISTFVSCKEGSLDVPEPSVNTSTAANTISTAYPSSTPFSKQQEIVFTDKNLEKAIRNSINKSIGKIYVSDVASIKTLSMRVCGITNLCGLEYLSSLEELDVYGNKINDLTPISKLASLRKLVISKNYNIFYSTPKKNELDLTPLRNLVFLEELECKDNYITDISPLSTLASLKKLTISSNRISNISSLANCKVLEYVDLNDNFYVDENGVEIGIEDISPLFGLKSLNTLLLESNKVSTLSGIESMSSLRYLNVSYNLIDSVEDLSLSKSIEYVNLSFNYIKDMTSIVNNTSLRSIDCSYNYITDFSFLINMVNLKKLYYEGNPINDESYITEFIERVS